MLYAGFCNCYRANVNICLITSFKETLQVQHQTWFLYSTTSVSNDGNLFFFSPIQSDPINHEKEMTLCSDMWSMSTETMASNDVFTMCDIFAAFVVTIEFLISINDVVNYPLIQMYWLLPWWAITTRLIIPLDQYKNYLDVENHHSQFNRTCRVQH